MLLVGLYKDQDSPLQMLRAPNDVMNDVMPIIWRHLTEQWQVGPKHNLLLREAPSLIFLKVLIMGNLGTKVLNVFHCLKKPVFGLKKPTFESKMYREGVGGTDLGHSPIFCFDRFPK